MEQSKISRQAIKSNSKNSDPVEKLKEAVDTNATDNPSMSIDPDTKKMAVVGDANALEKPDYKYKIEYEYSPDMVTEEDKKSLRYDKEMDKFYLDVTYENKRIKPIYRTKAVLVLTNILASSTIIDTSGYSSDQINGMVIDKIINDHIDDILDLAHIVLGVDKEQLEMMTIVSLIEFFTALLKNEPNIIGECVNFLLQSRNKLAKNTSAEAK